jgi:hypothetical protein
MTDEQKKSIESLGIIVDYFGRHASGSVVWQREFEISSQIYNLMSSKTDLFVNDFECIMDIFNKINENVHFEGSGWHDFKIRLNYSFRTFGYRLTWDKAENRIEAFDRI